MEDSENTPLIVNDESLEAGQGKYYYFFVVFCFFFNFVTDDSQQKHKHKND